MSRSYDAVLIVGFGGPERMEDVLPFLENVLRGRPVPEARKLEVAHHYESFGGVSPYNAQIRALMAALQGEFRRVEMDLPVYWGNRNWDPMLADTLRKMRGDGVQRALAFFVSAFSSYSGCRQYRENIRDAREEVGEGAPVIDKIRMCFNHPGFIAANADRVREAFARIDASLHGDTRLLFTAHSIPAAMADGCDYELQLKESAGLIAEAVGAPSWELVYQSRSGAPHHPWLEPDVCDRLEQLGGEGVRAVVICPVGFLSDHMEVLFDLDTEAADVCERLGLPMARAGTVGTHPRFITMIRELVEERLSGQVERPFVGTLKAWHDVCPQDCCLPGAAPQRPGAPGSRPLAVG